MNEKFLDQLAKQGEFLARIDERLAAYNRSLDEHMKRTSILEKEVHELWRWKFLIAGGLAVIAFAAPLLTKVIFK